MNRSKDPESMADILESLNISAPWRESRGRKPKYFFHHLAPGQVEKRSVPLAKARTIQTAMKQAANRQHIKITIQNKGNFLLIRRNK